MNLALQERHLVAESEDFDVEIRVWATHEPDPLRYTTGVPDTGRARPLSDARPTGRRGQEFRPEAADKILGIHRRSVPMRSCCLSRIIRQVESSSGGSIEAIGLDLDGPMPTQIQAARSSR